MRRWRNRIGPGEDNRTASAKPASSGEQQQRDRRRHPVDHVLDDEVPALRIDRVETE
jgi:hypothetical protein